MREKRRTPFLRRALRATLTMGQKMSTGVRNDWRQWTIRNDAKKAKKERAGATSAADKAWAAGRGVGSTQAHKRPSSTSDGGARSSSSPAAAPAPSRSSFTFGRGGGGGGGKDDERKIGLRVAIANAEAAKRV